MAGSGPTPLPRANRSFFGEGLLQLSPSEVPGDTVLSQPDWDLNTPELLPLVEADSSIYIGACDFLVPLIPLGSVDN